MARDLLRSTLMDTEMNGVCESMDSKTRLDDVVPLTQLIRSTGVLASRFCMVLSYLYVTITKFVKWMLY
jgi:hypothetical protein